MRRSRPQFLEPPSSLPPNLSFVLGISPSAMTLGLGNMRKLVSALGHPERQFRTAIVAGTNGKGSVTSLLADILHNQGMKVGCYTSPHIYDVTERIRVDGEAVSLEEMETAAARIVPLYEDIGYSYFEALTAIAFVTFANRRVDFAVLETGLGGRFDATNVVEPDVSVLTSIGLDHRRILGDTAEEILREKLGVTRSGVPLLTGHLDPHLDGIVEDRARRDGIPRRRLEELGVIDAEPMSFDGTRARVRTALADYGVLSLPYCGRHQLSNAILAIGAAETIAGRLERLGETAWARMPARFEVVPVDGKKVILDVAHNDDALINVVQTLSSLSPRGRNAVVLGLLARKELDRFPREVPRHARRLHLINPVPEESLAAPNLFERMGGASLGNSGLEVVLEGTFDEEQAWGRFVAKLLGERYESEVILVTGSHRTVEQFGRHLRKRLAT
jgi:dihydrofolate synthase/folylpolyglutamate synthase